MSKPTRPARPLRLRRRRRGAGLAEYGVLLALIGVAALGAVMLTGDRTRQILEAADLQIAAAPPPGGGGAGDPGVPPGLGTWSGDGAFALAAADGPSSRIFVLTNVGAGPLSLGSPAISGPDAAWFQILASDCPALLPPGESCAVEVLATAATDGTATARLGAAGAADNLLLTRIASGFTPLLSWSGDGTFALDGAPGAGGFPRTQARTFLLSNGGFAPATGIAPAASGAGFSLSATTCPSTLDIGAWCEATVEAAATANGAFSGALSSGGGAPATQPLSATAGGFVQLLTWSDDGAVLDTPAPPGGARTYTLTNAGTALSAPLASTLRIEGAGAAAFVASGSTCASPLAPGQSCSVQIRLAPETPVGAYAALLRADVPGGTSTALEGVVVGVATPDPFAFAALTDQPGGIAAISAPVAPTGFNVPVAASVSGDGSPEISTDGGATWGQTATLTPGGTIRARLQTGVPDGGVRLATVVAGGRAATWSVGVVDQMPDAFAFAPRAGEDRGVVSTSEPIVPTGFSTPAPVSVAGEGGPQISIAGGPWTTAGTIQPGQAIAVRLQTADAAFAPRVATVSIAGVQGAWSVSTGGADATPDAFSIAALTGQAPEAPVVSAPVVLTGFDTPIDLSAAGDGTPEISTNGGAAWAPSARLLPGQTFLVRMTAGPEGTTRVATVTAGGVAAPWSVQARVRDTTPDAFAIPALAGQPGGVLVESASVVPAGYTDPTSISASGPGSPEISVDGGGWTTAATISPGQSFRVRMTSPEPDGLSRSATVSVGGVAAAWSVQTVDTMHDPLGALSVVNIPIGNCAVGPSVTFAGFTTPAVFAGTTVVAGQAGFRGNFSSPATGVVGAGYVLSPGQTISLRACAALGTPLGATATLRYDVGGRTTDVAVQAVAQDHAPDLLVFPVVSGVVPGSGWVLSAAVPLTGVTAPVPVGFPDATLRNGAEFRINAGAWQTATLAPAGAGVHFAGPGDTIQLRQPAPAAVGQTAFTVLRIGSVNAAFPGGASYTVPWSVTTADPDPDPDPWPLNGTEIVRTPNLQFAPAAGVPVGLPNGLFRITGINVPVQASIELLTPTPGQQGFWINCEGVSRSDGQDGTGFCGGQTITIQPNQAIRPVVSSSPVAGETMAFRITIGTRSQTFTVRSDGPDPDVTPDAFSLTPVADAEPGALVVSAPVVPTGYGSLTRVSVSGAGDPQISVGGGPWITEGTIAPGQNVRVRLTAAPAADGTARTATLALGVSTVPGQSIVSAPFVVSTVDRTPVPIAFAAASGAEPGVLVTSAPAAISGLGGPVPFSVAGGLASIDGGPFAPSGVAANGQTIRLRLTAGPHGETRTATLSLGTASAAFTAATRALDATPDAFAIPPLADMPPGTLLQSAWVRPTGLLDPAPFSVAGGELLPEGGTWAASGVLEPGQRFRVRLTSAGPGQTATATATVGGVSADFVVASSP